MAQRLPLFLKARLAIGCVFLAGASFSSIAQSKSAPRVEEPAQAISIGGFPVVTLQRPPVTDKEKPQFLEATVLPGRGMAVLQIKAFLPGKGEIDLLNGPSLSEAQTLLNTTDDEWGNQ